MVIVGTVIYWVLIGFIVLLLVRFVVDWVQVLSREWKPRGPLLAVLEVVYSITDPPIRAVRSVIPPVRLGAMMLDLSPMIVLLACSLLLQVNALIFGA